MTEFLVQTVSSSCGNTDKGSFITAPCDLESAESATASSFQVEEIEVGHPELGAKVFLATQVHKIDQTAAGDHSYAAGPNTFPGLQVPFGLTLDHFPKIKHLLETDSRQVKAANVMMKPDLADTSLKNYTNWLKKLEEFCCTENLDFPAFSESTLLRFLAASFTSGEPYSFFCKALPAVKALETVLGTETSAITASVVQSINSLKREAAKKRPPTKKATLFSVDVLKTLYTNHIAPFEDNPWKIDASAFRSIVRGNFYYYTLCRFSDYMQLKDTDVSDDGNCLKIHFRKSKNDQFYEGSYSYIAEQPGYPTCPVKLIRLYYKRFNLHFDHQGLSQGYLNFRICKNGYHKALPKTRLGISSATKQFRDLLDANGFEGKKFTEKSFKVGGTTALCDAGEPIENVALAGRWKCPRTPLHYRNTSKEFRLGVARRIPN